MTAAQPALRTRWSEPGTYADAGAKTKVNTSIEFRHPISDVIGALLERGLTLELFHEFDHTTFARWPVMQRASDGTYRLPDDHPRLPLLYCLRLRKNAGL